MAAGSGERMNSKIPKQFLEINNQPILAYTFKVFRKIKNLNIHIVLPYDGFDNWKKYISKYVDKETILVRGGSHRNISVRNGVDSVTTNKGLIGIHDAVRPFLSENLISKLFLEAEKNGNAVPYTKSTNSIRRIDGKRNFAVERSEYVQIQTPQIFDASTLKKSLDRIDNNSYNDEASLIEELGVKINLVEGEENNIKITTEKDLNYFN